MQGEAGGLAYYLLGQAGTETGASCPLTPLACRLLWHRETPVLWASFCFTNPGPERTSFAASCFSQAFQGSLPLPPALVRGCPGFQGQNNLLPLLPGQQLPIHLAWRLHHPAQQVEIRFAALFPLPGQGWRETILLPAGKQPR